MSSELITILIGGGAFVFLAFLYLLLCSNSKEEAVEVKDQGGDDPAEREAGVEEKKQGGKSFKKLKQQNTKKGKKGGSGPDPAHGSFLAGLKGIMSPIVDADFFEAEEWLFVLVGEQDSRITAFAVEQGEGGKGVKSCTQSLKLDGGQKIASVCMS